MEVPIMGFRFRKRIKILPGVWFNLSKSGISTSIGGKGLTINLRKGKTMTTASLPGTGLSYRTTSTSKPDDPAPSQAMPIWILLLIMVVVIVWLTT
jgi:hypothetical protein